MRRRSPAIPAWALPHTVWVRVPRDGDGYGGEYGEPVPIRRVRLERSARVRSTDYQLQNAPTGTLYVDARSSAGAFEIPAGSLVRLDGEDAWSCAGSCRAFYDGSALHHWEVELS